MMLMACFLVGLANTAADSRALYANILKENVHHGNVDYAGVQARRAQLDSYLAYVEGAEVPEKRHAAMAFYIDAYNALVLRAVLDAGQPKSVRDERGFFKARTHKVAGKVVSLDELEKKVLGPIARDPRTHMVLVCAAKGCPILDPRPYVGSDLESRLEEATVRYLRSRAGARIREGAVSLSKIFEWYAGDFGGRSEVLRFVRKRLPKISQNATVSFFEYDWRLNGT